MKSEYISSCWAAVTRRVMAVVFYLTSFHVYATLILLRRGEHLLSKYYGCNALDWAFFLVLIYVYGGIVLLLQIIVEVFFNEKSAIQFIQIWLLLLLPNTLINMMLRGNATFLLLNINILDTNVTTNKTNTYFLKYLYLKAFYVRIELLLITTNTICIYIYHMLLLSNTA